MPTSLLALILFVQSATPSPEDPTPAQPGARAHHWLVYDEASKSVLLCGGSTSAEGDSSRFYHDIWSFDGAAWTRVGSLKRPESGVRLVCLPDGGGLVAFGGYTPSGDCVGDLRKWLDGAWTTIDPAGDQVVSESGFVLDRERGRFIAFGGTFAGGKRGTTWEWNGAAWRSFDGPGPEARTAHGMVYDQRRSRTVLFGGVGEGLLGDTWEWNGSAWTPVPGPGPAPRMAPGITYDTKRGRTVLYGGRASGVSLADTWVFDGTTWQELNVPGPPARMLPAMAYDPERDVVVLFGGRRAWPDDFADTWLFDGTSWHEARGR